MWSTIDGADVLLRWDFVLERSVEDECNCGGVVASGGILGGLGRAWRWSDLGLEGLEG